MTFDHTAWMVLELCRPLPGASTVRQEADFESVGSQYLERNADEAATGFR